MSLLSELYLHERVRACEPYSVLFVLNIHGEF